MTRTAEDVFGPDNPRDWRADHPSLQDSEAPHETAGVMRIQRTGKSGADLMVALKLKGTQLMSQLQKAMDDESSAQAAGRQIYDSPIRRGTK